MTASSTENPTACLLIIGNEVLSGRTRDANLQFIAARLGELGIPMREARVIPDVPETIVVDGERGARPLHPRLHHRRHRPDARRHHQRMRGPRLRRALGGPRGDPRPDGRRLRPPRPAGRVQRGADAHGDPAARRRAHPLRRDQRARLHHGQRPRHGRRAAHHALHVRDAGAHPGARAAGGVAHRARARRLRGQHRRRPVRDPVAATPRSTSAATPITAAAARRRRRGAGRQGDRSGARWRKRRAPWRRCCAKRAAKRVEGEPTTG